MELCAKVIKHSYISNVKLVCESEFVEKLSSSELSYLTHPKRATMLSTVLHTLSMSSSTSAATFAPISSEILGKLEYIHFFCSFVIKLCHLCHLIHVIKEIWCLNTIASIASTTRNIRRYQSSQQDKVPRNRHRQQKKLL